MNSEMFVEAIKLHVEKAAVEDTIASLKNPPGRRVSSESRTRSNWYNGLSEVEMKHVNDTVSIAVHEAVFGLLAVLDGVRTIDDEGGAFELTYVGRQRIILNDPGAIGLHDLINAS